ncbi:Na+ dependent nucleoside transporter C-terminus-domain-containing protein [Radiomyces spectabilis]|uniref:Na+ dependent nucleoside transporter C-terminus-domain-containing protein n=1 Tax=Radiomyces spectabilis TaxID=64574 RepID=UPI00221F7739|nr:Na+ dependent nucleoside transporter C-terminus-domain-containing protein [Radiomyces spectabilis]KAI8367483.1 Na+ dependent nucleoside transporter C-terminus-domain-containing protein [Radiomyces spectabilis]
MGPEKAADQDMISEDVELHRSGKFAAFYNKHIFWFHLVMWLIATGFVSAAFALQIPKGYNQENLILGLVYAWFSIYMFFCHVPTTVVTKPWGMLISMIAKPVKMVNPRLRSLLYGAFVFAAIAATVFAFPVNEHSSTRLQRLYSLIGLVIFIAIMYITSTNRRAINWTTITTALLLQFLLALFVFRTKAGHDIFAWAAHFCEGYLSKSRYGTEFVFGAEIANSGIFAVGVFPALIFFAATVQMLYYLGSLQWLLRKSAVIFVNVLRISGAEAVVACASPFLGQCENALLIKPFMPYLTNCEMHQVMASGFATISGSVLYAYISMGIPGQALLTSCVMSIPCSIAVSKMRYPEVDEPMTKGEVKVPESDEKAANFLHAAGTGAATGINICLLICANLISILALLYAVNAGLTWLGNFVSIQELTLQMITGYIFVPISWMIGTDTKDLVAVGQLMATKIWANEFVAYMDMMKLYQENAISERSMVVATYALCGFANLSSVGMQIGVLSSLAPKRAGDISGLALSAMICGAMSTWVSASIAGMLH